MSELRKAAQQALEALEKSSHHVIAAGGSGWKTNAQRCDRAMEALRAALAQPEPTNQCAETCERAKLCAVCARGLGGPEQEPVAWMYHGIRFDDTPHDSPSLIWRPEYMDAMSASKGVRAAPLYTAPPQRKPLRYITYVCPVCAASLEGQE